jgi:CBS-domain-containing membrane protein
VASTLALPEVLQRLQGQRQPLPVIDQDGGYLGVITAASVLAKLAMHRQHMAPAH